MANFTPHIVLEQYRYDAFGRRIWVKTHRTCRRAPNFQCEFSTVRRTVWDGQQELDEIQMPAMDSTPAATEESDTAAYKAAVNGGTLYMDVNVFFGRVLYTHGPSIDQPLSIMRVNYVDTTTVGGPFTVWAPFTIVPQWDYRGQPVAGFFTVASPAHQLITAHCADVRHCVFINWPAGWLAYDQKFFTPVSWHGTLVEGKRDGAETLYRRNRVYDPATGRFTQEDPLGLEGGINLYGFGNGDPLNFSDPFGTTVCIDEENRSQLKAALEKATNTRIALDKAGCITTATAKKGKGLEELQRRLNALVEPGDKYHLMSATGLMANNKPEPGLYLSLSRTAVIDFNAADLTHYPVRTSGVCEAFPLTSNHLSAAAVVAHELLGHGYAGTSDDVDADEKAAVEAENLYHSAAGEPERGCYQGDVF